MLRYSLLYFFGVSGVILLTIAAAKVIYDLSKRLETRIGAKAHIIVPSVAYLAFMSVYAAWLTTKLQADEPNIYSQISEAAQKKDRAEVLRLVKMLEAGHLSSDQPW